ITRPALVTQERLAATAKNQTSTSNAPKEGQEVWQGVLDVGSAKLRLVLKFSKTADGKLLAALDSPDQGVSGLAIDTITWQGSSLRFEMGLLGAVYEGTLGSDGSEIKGQWQQGGATLPLVFKRDGSASRW